MHYTELCITDRHGYPRGSEGDIVGQEAAKIDEWNVSFKLSQLVGCDVYSCSHNSYVFSHAHLF